MTTRSKRSQVGAFSLQLVAALLAAPLLLTMTANAQQGRGPLPETFPEPGQRSSPPRPDRDKASPKGKSAEAVPPKPIPKSIRPPGGSSVPLSGAERAKLLDELYAHLATAEDETKAGRVAAAIEHVWLTTGSDTVNLLVERARRALEQKKPEMAIRLLDRAALIAPDHPEIFNRRAAVHFGQNNLQASVGDLRRVLALEPNHYRAIETLGQIFKELGRKKAALEMYRKLNEIYPLMPGAKSALDELEREVKGQAS